MDSQSKENKCLGRELESAASTRGRIGGADAFIVVLRREDEGCKPEVRVYEVEGEVEGFLGHEDWEDERWYP